MKKPRKILTEIAVSGPFPPTYRAAMRNAVTACAKHLPASAWKKAPRTQNVTVSLSVVGRAKIRRLNHEYRGKDRPTDVLSFSASAVPGSDFLGDVVICWDIAKRQNETFNTTPRQEVQRLIVHGILHLFGYDHERSKAEAKKMFRLQDKILKNTR